MWSSPAIPVEHLEIDEMLPPAPRSSAGDGDDEACDCEEGGQGFPHVVAAAAKEWFIHNPAFLIYFADEGAAHLIEVYGTEAQKKRYLRRVRGHGADRAGCGNRCRKPQDEGDRRPDGTFGLCGDEAVHHRGGQRPHGEHHPAGPCPDRGDPRGTGGISIFLVVPVPRQ